MPIFQSSQFFDIYYNIIRIDIQFTRLHTALKSSSFFPLFLTQKNPEGWTLNILKRIATKFRGKNAFVLGTLIVPGRLFSISCAGYSRALPNFSEIIWKMVFNWKNALISRMLNVSSPLETVTAVMQKNGFLWETWRIVLEMLLILASFKISSET